MNGSLVSSSEHQDKATRSTERRTLALRLSFMVVAILLPALLASFAAPSAFGQGFKVTDLDAPGNVNGTYPLGLNTAGAVVGEYENSTGGTSGFYYNGTSFTELSYGGQNFTRGNGINDSNVVVGDFFGSDGLYHGFTYISGTFQQYDVGVESNVSTSLFGINKAGDFVGSWVPLETQVEEGFISPGGRGGKVTSFYAAGTDSTYAYAIDSSDNAVGAYVDTKGVTHCFARQAANGVITTIDYPGSIATVCYGINDSGLITGTYTNKSGLSYGFTYAVKTKTFAPTDFAGTRGVNSKGAYAGWYWGVDGFPSGYLAVPQAFNLTAVKLPNSKSSFLNGVNNANVGVGSYVDSSGAQHGLMATLTTIKAIDDPKGPTVCYAINSGNVVVGDYFDSGGNPHGFQYSNGTFSDIPGPSDALSSDATGINDAGVVVGDYFSGNDRTHHGFIYQNGQYTVVDVPAALATFSGGINKSGLATFSWIDFDGYRQSSLYNGSTFTLINVPGAAITQAQGINSAGNIVFFWSDPYGVGHAALKEGNSYYVFDEPKGTNAAGAGINDSNLIVGSFTLTGGLELFYGTM